MKIKGFKSLNQVVGFGEKEEYKENPIRKKKMGNLIFLVAFTAIMLIVSTYAWFSTQRNVSLNGLEGKVEVAEGLMVSLDAKNWTQEINFLTPENHLEEGYTLEHPYDYDVDTPRKNVIPTEMIPASTIAKEDIVSKDVVDSGNTDLTLYREK